MSKVRERHLAVHNYLAATFTFMLNDGLQAVSVGNQFTGPLRGNSLAQRSNDSN